MSVPPLSMMFEFDHQAPDIFLRRVARLVDPIIKEVLLLSVDEKRKKLVNYQISTGGKRLRPALAVASCLTCGGMAEDALYPAAGVEILHNCSLIYDDIIDNSSLRRGKSTVWSKFGTSIAQCVGLDYSAAIFQAANRSRNPLEVSELFARTMKAVVEGEIRDILLEQRGRDGEKYVVRHRRRTVEQEDYLQMVSQKTACLMQVSCEVGAISAGAEEEQRDALRAYGFNLGVAFQIGDDILDIFGEEQEFGKKIGKDIEERKMGNIVILHALDELTSSGEHRELLAILRKNRLNDRDVHKALNLISSTGARQRSLLLGQEYSARAKRSLQGLPENKWNGFLARIVDSAIDRKR